jgi:acetyltransferase-like isoleucine patch superfamily enzyme
MNAIINNTNQIDQSAVIGENVKLGSYNIIGKNVVIEGFKDSDGIVDIGDCNIIHEGTRILAGTKGIKIGDWNVFHNNMLVMGDLKMTIGHNCWFGQNTILDSSGGLEIGNGVRVGMYSQIWTHVASGELIEGCTLYGMRKTIINDDVWLVGSCMVSSGVVIGKRGVYLPSSNITKSTEENKVYAGNPAKEMPQLNFYKAVTIDEKFKLMRDWVEEFSKINACKITSDSDNSFKIFDENNLENITFFKNRSEIEGELVNDSWFDVTSKTYSKTLSVLERQFYKFIYNNKARFLPYQ